MTRLYLLSLLLLAAPAFGQPTPVPDTLNIQQTWNAPQDFEAFRMNVHRLTMQTYVVITVKQPPQPIACPPQEPQMLRNEDGSYSRRRSMTVNSVACYSNPQTWRERWTAYPEQGGKFIERIEER